MVWSNAAQRVYHGTIDVHVSTILAKNQADSSEVAPLCRRQDAKLVNPRGLLAAGLVTLYVAGRRVPA